MLLPLLACVVFDSFPSALSEHSFVCTALEKKWGIGFIFLEFGPLHASKNLTKKSSSFIVKSFCYVSVRKLSESTRTLFRLVNKQSVSV